MCQHLEFLSSDQLSCPTGPESQAGVARWARTLDPPITTHPACPGPLLPIVVRMSPMNDTRWSPVGADDAYRYSATTLSAFWPEAEHGKLIDRWPHLATEVGATWDEHRQQIERHCALVERAGYAVNQVSGDVSGLESFLQDRHVTTPSAQDLLAYLDLRTQPVMIRWPPGRIAMCWCGSGRKYKQCCRPHSLSTLD